jgi:PAS domain S-box-containing protein
MSEKNKPPGIDEATYQTILQSAMDGFWIVDRQGQLKEVNEAYVRMSGYSRDELLAMSIRDVEALQTETEILERIQMIKESGGARFETRHRRKDGGLIDVESTVKLMPRKNGEMVAFIRDITDRKRSEAALRESEFFFKESQRAASIGSYKTDFTTGYWESSEVLDSIFGIDGSYERNVPGWLAIVHPDDKAMMDRYLREEVIGKRGQFSKEYRIIRIQDGETRWVYGLGTVSFDPRGIPLFMIGTIQDITVRKKNEEENSKLQAQLQQSQKMESLGRLAGGIAHDMNNVLAAILATASVGINSLPSGRDAAKSFETISRAASRGAKLVKSLLTFARQSPVDEAELDINAILREAESLVERTVLSKVHIEMDLAPDLGHILGDANALTNTVVNLCINAIDAMSGKGTLTLRTVNRSEEVEVQVEDTGTGMPKEIIDKAFDPFFTTKPAGKGTGLGLPLVFATVKAHRGRVEIQSEPGRGTRVLLWFPMCASGACEEDPETESKVVSAFTPLNVLLADDDEIVRQAFREEFEILGHRVTITASGEESLALLDGGLRPDLVVLDVTMPGLGGEGTLPILRSLYPDLPVLLITGRIDQPALDLAAMYPRVTLLPKPFTFDELKRKLDGIGRTERLFGPPIDDGKGKTDI